MKVKYGITTGDSIGVIDEFNTLEEAEKCVDKFHEDDEIIDKEENREYKPTVYWIIRYKADEKFENDLPVNYELVGTY